MPTERQPTFPWVELQLRNLMIPTTAGVSGDVLRDVLIAIYLLPGDAGQNPGKACWAGQAAIATRAGCSERTVRRALHVLEHNLELVVSYRASPPGARTRKTLDHYLIVWTEVGCLSDGGANGVTRPSVTRPMPATRPGQDDSAAGDTDGLRAEETPGSEWPVDRPPWPVDRPPWPVDRPPWPVDRPRLYMPARANSDPELRSTSAATSSPDPERTERTDWAAVAAVLSRSGVRTAHQRVDDLRRRGVSPTAALEEVALVVRTAQANAWRFSSPAQAIAYRIATGDWPCEVDEDLDGVAATASAARSAKQDHERWESLCAAAYRQVRSETPAGQYVDETAVVAAAVAAGVPRAVAERSRGVSVGNPC